MSKPRLATVWLAGCSGCHMSFLDLDEWLIDLAQAVDSSTAPSPTSRSSPTTSTSPWSRARWPTPTTSSCCKQVRERSKIVISFGDCAVHGNVSAMRNPLGDPGVIVAEAYRTP
jgi:NAD-reducing hydrogenase small subunit